MPQTIAFLGATGGCANACLIAALKDGHTCRALARTPQKLLTSLTSQGVSETLLTNLEIISGNAKDASALTDLLRTPEGAVDTILFGVGAAPVFRWHIMPVTLDDTHLCRTAMATLLSVLSTLQSPRKPKLLVISTTGITSGPRDVPMLYIPLYHWLLAVPHEDKAVMEKLVWEQKSKTEGQRVIGQFAIVRPTLLGDGKGVGWQKVRYGVESKPALGWMIDRKDVGEWMFERLVKPQELGEFEDTAVALTA